MLRSRNCFPSHWKCLRKQPLQLESSSSKPLRVGCLPKPKKKENMKQKNTSIEASNKPNLAHGAAVRPRDVPVTQVHSLVEVSTSRTLERDNHLVIDGKGGRLHLRHSCEQLDCSVYVLLCVYVCMCVCVYVCMCVCVYVCMCVCR